MVREYISDIAKPGLSMTTRVPYLDGWRGLAILFVLASHFFDLGGVEFGWLGVDIFFVLSGLLMAKILFVRRVSLKDFYVRRISRILPVFLIYVGCIYGAGYLFWNSEESANVLSTVFFLRTYLPSDPSIWHTDLPIGHIWSLNVEEHSYVFLSLVTTIAVLRNREPQVLLGVALLSLLIFIFYSRHPEMAPIEYATRTETAASFLMMSAGYSMIKDKFEAYVQSWMPLFAFAATIFCYTDLTPWYFESLVAPFLLAFSVNHLDRLHGYAIAVLSWTPLRLIGIWSYSIYLWQQPFYQFGVRGTAFDWQNSLLWLVAALMAGVTSFYLVENPLRASINRKWAPGAPALSVPR